MDSPTTDELSWRSHLQLGIGIGSLGSVKRHSQEVRAHGGVEDAVAPLAVVIDDLVDNVPVVALALVVADDILNVRLDNALELLVREATVGDWGQPVSSRPQHTSGSNIDVGLTPSRKLAVPGQGVAAEELAVLSGNAGNDVALLEVELAAVGLGGIPLLPVLGSQLANLARVARDGHVLGVVGVALADGRAEEVRPAAWASSCSWADTTAGAARPRRSPVCMAALCFA